MAFGLTLRKEGMRSNIDMWSERYCEVLLHALFKDRLRYE